MASMTLLRCSSSVTVAWMYLRLEGAGVKAGDVSRVALFQLPNPPNAKCLVLFHSLPVHDLAVLGNDLELLRGSLGHVNGVHISTSLDVSKSHLQTKTSVTTRDDGSLALEGELGENRSCVVV